MYAGSGNNYCELSIEPTQELSVTLVTLHRFYSVTLVTLHKSLSCHFGDPIQKFFSVTSVTRASYWSVYTELVVGPESKSPGPVISPFPQSQYRFTSTGPAIDPNLQDQ